jgi:hypothetical protein
MSAVVDIFHPCPPERALVVTKDTWTEVAHPEWEGIIREQCDADRARALRASFPYSMAQLALNPVDGRIPQGVA